MIKRVSSGIGGYLGGCLAKRTNLWMLRGVVIRYGLILAGVCVWRDFGAG